MVDKQKPKIELVRFFPVALWSLDMKIENCAICRNHIMDTCVECQNGLNTDDEDCKVSWGTCLHAFHRHCISRWLLTKPVCPLDSKPWVLKEDPENKS